MKIGSINNVIIFGGGKLVIEFSRIAKAKNLPVAVFAVRRHLKEQIKLNNGKISLEDALKKEKIIFFETPDINKSTDLANLVVPQSLGIGVGEAYVFTKETLSRFGNKIFDFMTIDIPRYRGGAHFTWMILAHEKQGCWNIQQVNSAMIPGVFDSGKILLKRSYRISGKSPIPADYFVQSEKEGVEIFKDFLNLIQKNQNFELINIHEDESMFLPRLSTINQGYINWLWSAEEIHDFICAFDDPYEGASSFVNKKRIFIKKCHLNEEKIKFHPFMAGIIYRKQGESLFVAARDGSLIIKEILYNQRNIISELNLGQRLFTPVKYLEKAMLFEARYNDKGLFIK